MIEQHLRRRLRQGMRGMRHGSCKMTFGSMNTGSTFNTISTKGTYSKYFGYAAKTSVLLSLFAMV